MSKKKKKEENKASQEGTAREYFTTVVYCTIIALFLTTYVVHPMTVPTESMEPTILVGDRLLVDKFGYRSGFSPFPGTPSREVRRGDIVVFKFPPQPEELYVKRVIGLPGEEISVRDYRVHINGQPIDEPYKVHALEGRTPGDPRLGADFGPVKIPDDHYFAMGDNRDLSLDSRVWGFLPKSHVLGSPLVVFWSYPDPAQAHKIDSFVELAALWIERIVYFLPRTRWDRLGRVE